MTVQHVRIAARMYDARDTLRSLMGEKYPALIGKMRPVIEAATRKHNCGVLEACVRACGLPDVRHDGMLQLLIMATAVEMIESPERPAPAVEAARA